MSEWIHIIQDWLLEYGVLSLILVSFTESSFFPIPPDVLLIPMGITNPDSAYWYAFLTTAFSVLGAILGWYIGKKLGRPVLRYFIKEEKIQIVEDYFKRYGALAIVIAGFTPIPYKVFTVFSGISKIRIRTLVFWSIIGRGARFFLEAAIITILGKNAEAFINDNFSLLTAVVGGIIIIGYIVYILLKKRKKQIN